MAKIKTGRYSVGGAQCIAQLGEGKPLLYLFPKSCGKRPQVTQIKRDMMQGNQCDTTKLHKYNAISCHSLTLITQILAADIPQLSFVSLQHT